MIRRLQQGSNDKYFALADSVGRSVLRMAVNVLIARLAGVNLYGTFIVLLTLEVIWTTLLYACLLTPVITVSPDQPRDNQASLIAGAIKIIGVASILAGALLFIVVGVASPLDISPVVWVGFILATILQSVGHGFRAWRNLTFTSWYAFWADMLGLLVPILSVTVVWYFARASNVLAAFWWSSVFGNMLMLVVMAGRDASLLLTARPVNSKQRRRLFRLGRVMGLGSIAYSAGSRAQPILLAALAAGIEVSRLGATLTLIGPIRMLTMALCGVVRPRLGLYYGRSEQDRAVRLTMHAVLICTLMALALMALLMPVGEYILTHMFGEWMSGSRLLVAVAVTYAWLECVGSVLVTALQAQDDRGASDVTRLRIAGSVIALIMMWPACSMYGALGAFSAMVLVETGFVACCAVIWRGRSGSPIRMPDIT